MNWIEVDVVEMGREIALVADQVLPVAPSIVTSRKRTGPPRNVGSRQGLDPTYTSSQGFAMSLRLTRVAACTSAVISALANFGH